MPGRKFTDEAARRISKATREAELRPRRRQTAGVTRGGEDPPVARFRLVSPLEVGGTAAGRRLALEETAEGELRWIQTDREEILYSAAGWQLRWDVGHEVTAVRGGRGWMVDGTALMGASRAEIIPYAVLTLARGESSRTPRGVIVVGPIHETPQERDEAAGVAADSADEEPEGQPASIPFWRAEYCFAGAIANQARVFDDRPTPDPDPEQERWTVGGVDEPRWLRPIPVTSQLPCWAAYEPQQDDGSLRHPVPGEYWGPRAGSQKLHRSSVTLELYWWEWKPPDWVVIENPDWDPEDPESPEFVWGDEFGPASPLTSALLDPPPLPESEFWIAPDGWWTWGGWAWGYFYRPTWRVRRQFPTVEFTPWLPRWGWWGYGWWGYRWGGFPPLAGDLPDPSVPMPEPEAGEVIQRDLAREIRWRYGWRVLAVDRDREICLITEEQTLFVTHQEIIHFDSQPDPTPQTSSY